MLDLYNPCPCHPERKLKFCCGKDVVAAFSKSLEMLDGGQRIKGIQTLDKGIAQFGHRDCLTGIRFALHLEDEHVAEAKAICEAYGKENGINCMAWTMKSLLALEEGQISEAVDHLQSAMETGEPPSSIFGEAVFNLGIALGKMGANPAARDHFALYVQATGDPQGVAGRYLELLRQAMSVTLPRKHDWPLMPIPDGRDWSVAAAQALHWAETGLWRKAYQVLRPLALANPSEATLWRNVAVLSARLGYRESELEAWGKYAQCPGVHPDHAVEAEYCSIEELPADGDTYDEVVVTFSITDLDGFLEQTAHDPELKSLPSHLVQPLSIRNDENPRAIFFAPINLWGDQESVVCFDGSTVQASHLMAVVVYGKRTDRPAQLTFGVTALPPVLELIQKIIARYPQVDVNSREVRGVQKHFKMLQDLAFDRIVGLKRAVPDSNVETDATRWENFLLRTVPGYRTSLLGGASFAEAMQDPSQRRRVEALLLLLECEYTILFDVRPIFSRLRTALGLPTPELLSPKSVRLPELSLQQFARLDFGQMPIRLLAWAFNTAMAFSNVNAMRSLVSELERRLELPNEADELKQTIPLASVYLVMAKIEGELPKVSRLLRQGMSWLPNDPRQQCDWLIKALEVTISRGLVTEVPTFMSVLSSLAETDEYCLAALIRVHDLLGIPAPGLDQMVARSNAGIKSVKPSAIVTQVSEGAAGVRAAVPQSTAPTKLWLPGS
ncbi:MAG: hypothetical protein JNL67_12990 [Planctomycetaceae bacterium]|nr:hypothetical protein [Planctomycetaceae bacterium]